MRYDNFQKKSSKGSLGCKAHGSVLPVLDFHRTFMVFLVVGFSQFLNLPNNRHEK